MTAKELAMEFYKDINTITFNTEDVFVKLSGLSTEALDDLLDKLYCDWFDARKTLDEQMIVNTKFSPNYYLYESRELEAKSKFLYVKAIRMMTK